MEAEKISKNYLFLYKFLRQPRRCWACFADCRIGPLLQDAELELCPKSRQTVDSSVHGQDGTNPGFVHGSTASKTTTDVTVSRQHTTEGT